MSKETLRKAIAKHVREYLARGGVIEQVPSVIFCPKHMKWARDRGLDWMPWEQFGGAGYGYYLEDLEATGEGCYITRPKEFEGSEDR
jgi:hypothetical protein